ncbi:MAG: nucleotidyltransferase family protein [Victivallales bacterium]|nr:nucleotidyltransferase family protein [Victivallales bacterium]
MYQLDRLQQLRSEILEIARKHNAEKVYVFGSCARKEERPESDVDLLVDFNQDATLFDQVDIRDEIHSLLNCKVDVVSRRGLHPYIKRRVLAEAIEL